MKRPLLYCIILLLTLPLRLAAQMPQVPALTWDDFVQEYAADELTDDGTTLSTEELEWLEGVALHPLQLNRVTRSQLLALPFVSEAQADSMLTYRAARRGVRHMGELQLVSGIDYYTRRYLSLFVRCDSAYVDPSAPLRVRPTIGALLTGGRHEIETRADLPLYRREGYDLPEQPSKTNYYTGNALHHIVRYRYNEGREAAYGLTLEKDAGEPVCKQGFAPYDYWSGYVMLRPADRPWSFVAGDYEVRGGRGLLFGRLFFAGREQALQGAKRQGASFRPHTGSDESRFFRGVAAAFVSGRWQVMAFASYRKLDARLYGDTVRTILTTGLHRTVSEIERRRNLGALTAGAHVGYAAPHFMLQADGYVGHYDRYVAPQPRFYNRYYFSGRTAGGGSLSYYWAMGAWAMQGEVAADYHLHLATDHQLSYSPSRSLTFTLQARSFSPRFVSLYGEALQQGSRVANEQGVFLGGRYRSRQSWELSGYVDLFRFPESTYTAVVGGAKGIEAQVTGKWQAGQRWHLITRYRIKARQRTISGYHHLEYRQTHRLRFGAQWTGQRFEVTSQFDGTLALRQTGRRVWGGALSARCTWRATRQIRLRASAALFDTDDYESAVYVYEPQLLRAASFGALFYQGARAVALCDWQALPSLTLSLRLASLRYFDRSEQSSGPATIHSPWRNDLSVQLRWRLC